MPVGTQTPSLYDTDIRWSLHHWLKAKHATDPETKLIHELKIPRPSARIDLAVVNGKLAGFEIKSDRDSLIRLPRQVRSFSQVFDAINVVTTIKHVGAIERAIPAWWGVITVGGGEGVPRFSMLRPSNTNPEFNLTALLHTLHRTELIWLLRQAGISQRGTSGKAQLVDCIKYEIPERFARNGARDAIRHHRSETGLSSHSS